MRKAWNRQGKNSNPITSAEATNEGITPIQVLASTSYDPTYHTKQLGKGLLVFGAGLLGYFGFSTFFGSKQEANISKTKHMIDGNLFFPEENLLNVQATISAIPTSLEHKALKKFVPTSFSAARTLLSLQEKKVAQSGLEVARAKDYVEADKEGTPTLASIRRAALEISYQGGDEFQVNTYASYGRRPEVAAFPAGGFVVVWDIQVTHGYRVYGQCYNAAAQAVGSEFQMPYSPRLYPSFPHVTGLAEGSFVVVLNRFERDGDPWGVYGQRYNKIGQPMGNEFQVNTYTPNSQVLGAVSSLTEGSFVVVWSSLHQDFSRWGVYGQRYNAIGQPVGSEFRVNTYTLGDQIGPSVTSLITGGFVVVWKSSGSGGVGNRNGIYGQRYNTIGQPVGPEFRVTYTAYTAADSVPSHLSVIHLTEGGFVVVWQIFGQDGDRYGVYGQRCKDTGQRDGIEFLVNTYTSSNQQYPKVTSLPEGGFVVVWESRGQDGGSGVYGQLYNTAGQAVGPEFQVTGITGTQYFPALTSLTEGGFVVTWQQSAGNGHSSGIYGRIFSSNSYPILLNNKLTIEEGETIILTSTLLSAMDPDSNNATLIFTVNNVSHGYFEKSDNIKVIITNFIQQEIMNNQIHFVHDGSKSAPEYAVKVSDGSFETAYQAANVVFVTINNAPQMVNNKLTLAQGERIIVNSDMLSATDADDNDNSLFFRVKNVEHGYFSNIEIPKQAIATFTQQEIINGDIRFTHDNSPYAPRYQIEVMDQDNLSSGYKAGNIDFSVIKSVDYVISYPYIVVSVGCITGTALITCIAVGGIGFFALKYCKKSQQQIIMIKHELQELKERVASMDHVSSEHSDVSGSEKKQDIELKDIPNEKQGIVVEYREPTVTQSKQGLFQPPSIVSQGPILILSEEPTQEKSTLEKGLLS